MQNDNKLQRSKQYDSIGDDIVSFKPTMTVMHHGFAGFVFGFANENTLKSMSP